jgi:hypothetical protein
MRPAAAPEPAFSCPVCHMTSRGPGDIARGYCGNCHDFTREVVSFAGALHDLGVAGFQDLPAAAPGSKLANALAAMAEEASQAAVELARAVAAALLEGGDEMRWQPGDPEW